MVGGKEGLRGVDHRRRRRGDLHRERAGLPLAQDISRHRGNDCERQADTAVTAVVLTVESALGWGGAGSVLCLFVRSARFSLSASPLCLPV